MYCFFCTTDNEYLSLKEVEYVGHLITSTGTSFTEVKRLQVLDFPLPETEKALLQFIGLANYFRDHVPKMTEMVQLLRKLMDMKKYHWEINYRNLSDPIILSDPINLSGGCFRFNSDKFIGNYLS